MVQRFLPLAGTDRDCLHVLARSLPLDALAAMLNRAHRGPPITGGVGGAGNGHGRINASPAALIRARPFCSSFARVYHTVPDRAKLR